MPFLFTIADAQKFKMKFDECKEEVRKSLEGTIMAFSPVF